MDPFFALYLWTKKDMLCYHFVGLLGQAPPTLVGGRMSVPGQVLMPGQDEAIPATSMSQLGRFVMCRLCLELFGFLMYKWHWYMNIANRNTFCILIILKLIYNYLIQYFIPFPKKYSDKFFCCSRISILLRYVIN